MGLSAFRLPRSLHPGAWWLWALGLAVASSATTNPLILLLIVAVACLVVVARRPDAPWAAYFRLYLFLGGIVVAIRLLFRVVFNGNGPTVLFSLPRIPLPQFVAGIQLLGPVSAEALLGGLYAGLQLAAMIVCIGAANALANPKRLLAAMPSAVYEIGTVVVVATSVLPQLAESVGRVRRARTLRPAPRGRRHRLRTILVPVLADALDRSLLLAAAMDSRGYGRRAGRTRASRLVTSILLVAGVVGLAVGAYGVMDAGGPAALGAPMLVGGAVAALAGFALAGRRVTRSRYRPDRWRTAEVLVAACGVAVAAAGYTAGRMDVTVAHPMLYPIALPAVSALWLAGLVLAALPAVLAPPPPPSAPTPSGPTPTVSQAARHPDTVVTVATGSAHR